jgi:hypothetical protein
MDFEALKKLIEQQKLAKLAGQTGPKDLGNTANLARGIALDSYVGDVKTPEAIEPTDSPIDYLAAGAGAKLGGAMARDAGGILGNEIGAIGNNIKNKVSPALDLPSRSATEAKFAAIKAKLVPMLQEKGVIGNGTTKFADDAVIHNELSNIVTRGLDTGHTNMFDKSVAEELATRANRHAALNEMQNPYAQKTLEDLLKKSKN